MVEKVIKKKKKKLPAEDFSGLKSSDDKTAESTKKKKKASKGSSDASVGSASSLRSKDSASSLRSKGSASSLRSKRSVASRESIKSRKSVSTVKSNTSKRSTKEFKTSPLHDTAIPLNDTDESQKSKPPKKHQPKKHEPQRGVRRTKSDDFAPGLRRTSSGDDTATSIPTIPESPEARGREIPSKRGIKRYGSMPTSPGTRRGGRRAGLGSISEDDFPPHKNKMIGKGGRASDGPASAMNLGTGDGIRVSTKNVDNGEDCRSPRSPKQMVGKGRGSTRPASATNLAGVVSSQAPSGPPLSRRGAPPPRSRSSDLETLRRPPSGKILRTKSADFDFSSDGQPSHKSPPARASSATETAPQSILRTSSHHIRPPRRAPSPESSGDDEMVSINFESRQRQRSERYVKRSGTSQSIEHSSGHSIGTSTRSQLSVDRKNRYFENDTNTQKVLRYLRIFPPHPDEKPVKKWIRRFTWWALVLDFVAAMVSITTYKGVTTCCGKPIYSAAADIDWNQAIRITTYVYLALIFCEIIPVIRQGIPFNLINPFVGFTIFFAMFFDDRASEAICMWFIESTAILLEFLVYRLKSGIYHEREARLVQCDKDLEGLKSKSKKSFIGLVTVGDDDDSISIGSFGEDNEDLERSGSKNPELKQMRLFRERRSLRLTQKTDRLELRYHFIGVVINLGLVGISLTLVIVIATSGGLCFRDMRAPSIFSNDQLESCYLCQDWGEGVCQVCNEEDGTSQCYYPYY